MRLARKQTLTASFWALNVSQFFSAVCDNLFRWTIAAALMIRSAAVTDSRLVTAANEMAASQAGAGEAATSATAAGGAASGAVSSAVWGAIASQGSLWPLIVVCILWVAPFLPLSSVAGGVAGRYSKRDLLVSLQWIGVGLSLLGFVAFLSGSSLFLYLIVLLMACRAVFFETCRLAILPEIVPRSRLSLANGLMSAFACLGIGLGGCVGLVLYDMHGSPAYASAIGSTSEYWPVIAVGVVAAVLALAGSVIVTDSSAGAPGKPVSLVSWKGIYRSFRGCAGQRYRLLALLGAGFFFFVSAYVLINLPFYGIDRLGLSRFALGWLILSPVAGAMVGAAAAGRISGRGVEVGLVPMGALVVSGAAFLLAIPFLTAMLAEAAFFLLGFGAGLFLVPLRTFLQTEPLEPSSPAAVDRDELIGTSVFLSYSGMVLAALLTLVLGEVWRLGLGARFTLLAVASLVACAYVLWLLPDFLIRFLGLLVAQVSYRLHVHGEENIPERGGALLVCNHVSSVDAVLLTATQTRRIRFIIDRSAYDRPAFHGLLRLMGAVRIAYNEGDEAMREAYREARRAIDEGFLVCLFAEGSLTRTGYLMEFKRGFEQIVRDSPHPIIPVNLHGVWGSLFSYGREPGGRERIWAQVRGWFPGRRVIVSFGEPLPPDATAYAVRRAVMELEAEAFEHERPYHQPLPLEFAKVARAAWGRRCLCDTLGRNLTYGETLTAAVALAKVLAPDVAGQERVGVLLPTSVTGALANIALSLLGKTVVNLNYTAPREAVESAIRQCKIRTILTSEKFLAKVDFSYLSGLLRLEDVAPRVTRAIKIRAYLKARLCPRRFLMIHAERAVWRRYGLSVEEPAAIIFSSGTTGDPKGVVLSHYNVLSNILGVRQIFRLRPGDVICATLPFFHSFGYTVTIWLPLMAGVGVAYHPNPVEAARIGKLVAEKKCTFIVSTPTFLFNYVRKVPVEDFASLRVVVTGAEKLKDRISAAYTRKFGVTPLEGYGTTELSPVVSVNMPNVQAGGEAQVAHRPGSIGRPIPGVAVKVVDPDDLDRELDYGEEGMLLVKGPNVMKGYLGRPDKTAEVMRHGWYVTGDVARIDHDGFITITDRLSRFSKIGGEMVPHGAVEDALQEALGAESQVCAVTSVPDERRGERLIVFLTPEAGAPAAAYRKLREAGLPNLWVPAPNDFVTVSSLPILGTGKLDLKGLKALAMQSLGEEQGKPQNDA